MPVDEFDIARLERLVDDRPDLSHLCIKKHGKSLILYSGSPNDPFKHARFTLLGKREWQLSFPLHTGRWETTPFIGTLDEMFTTAADAFGWHLAPFHDP